MLILPVESELPNVSLFASVLSKISEEEFELEGRSELSTSLELDIKNISCQSKQQKRKKRKKYHKFAFTFEGLLAWFLCKKKYFKLIITSHEKIFIKNIEFWLKKWKKIDNFQAEPHEIQETVLKTQSLHSDCPIKLESNSPTGNILWLNVLTNTAKSKSTPDCRHKKPEG